MFVFFISSHLSRYILLLCFTLRQVVLQQAAEPPFAYLLLLPCYYYIRVVIYAWFLRVFFSRALNSGLLENPSPNPVPESRPPFGPSRNLRTNSLGGGGSMASCSEEEVSQSSSEEASTLASSRLLLSQLRLLDSRVSAGGAPSLLEVGDGDSDSDSLPGLDGLDDLGEVSEDAASDDDHVLLESHLGLTLGGHDLVDDLETDDDYGGQENYTSSKRRDLAVRVVAPAAKFVVDEALGGAIKLPTNDVVASATTAVSSAATKDLPPVALDRYTMEDDGKRVKMRIDAKEFFDEVGTDARELTSSFGSRSFEVWLRDKRGVVRPRRLRMARTNYDLDEEACTARLHAKAPAILVSLVKRV